MQLSAIEHTKDVQEDQRPTKPTACITLQYRPLMLKHYSQWNSLRQVRCNMTLIRVLIAFSGSQGQRSVRRSVCRLCMLAVYDAELLSVGHRDSNVFVCAQKEIHCEQDNTTYHAVARTSQGLVHTHECNQSACVDMPNLFVVCHLQWQPKHVNYFTSVV